jgi:predicted chitinase
MTIQLTPEGLRKIFPRAPESVIAAFVNKQAALDKAGVSHTRTRLSHFFANIEHECGGFTIPRLTENINYTHARAAAVWPNRFRDAAHVREKYGDAPGWQLRMLDDVYGNRMGNRPGTRDGSRYIGRGGPQWTGRDGYSELEKRSGLPAVATPESAAVYEKQPEVCVAFWDWKNLNALADAGNFRGVVKRWNGGTNGMADRLAKLEGNDPFIKRLENVERTLPTAKELPGSPPTKTPPKEVIDATTKKERATQKAGAGSVAAGGVGEATKAGTEVPTTPLLSPLVTYTMIGVGVVIVIVSAVLIAQKKAAVIRNWF